MRNGQASLPRAVADAARSAGRTQSKRERAKETRRELVRTAARLWSERGFDDVTVEEICSAAGVGRTTFYLHFESKERLLGGLASGTAAGVAAELDAARPAGDLAVQVDVFIRGVVRRMEAVPKTLVELVVRSQHGRKLARARADGPLGESTRFADLLQGVLAEAQDRGEVVRTVDVAELGEILGAVTMDAIEAWASDRVGDRSLDAVLRRRFALVLEPQFTPSPT